MILHFADKWNNDFIIHSVKFIKYLYHSATCKGKDQDVDDVVQDAARLLEDGNDDEDSSDYETEDSDDDNEGEL